MSDIALNQDIDFSGVVEQIASKHKREEKIALCLVGATGNTNLTEQMKRALDASGLDVEIVESVEDREGRTIVVVDPDSDFMIRDELGDARLNIASMDELFQSPHREVINYKAHVGIDYSFLDICDDPDAPTPSGMGKRFQRLRQPHGKSYRSENVPGSVRRRLAREGRR